MHICFFKAFLVKKSLQKKTNEYIYLNPSEEVNWSLWSNNPTKEKHIQRLWFQICTFVFFKLFLQKKAYKKKQMGISWNQKSLYIQLGLYMHICFFKAFLVKKSLQKKQMSIYTWIQAKRSIDRFGRTTPPKKNIYKDFGFKYAHLFFLSFFFAKKAYKKKTNGYIMKPKIFVYTTWLIYAHLFF